MTLNDRILTVRPPPWLQYFSDYVQSDPSLNEPQSTEPGMS
jgi:hypothetical protein